jgi:catechol 2,3-dioxygenase-like lactoylglutathione lyase family enzyme
MANVTGLNHVNVRCTPDNMEATREFYEDLMDLKPGYRPNFTFPGYWMYAGDHPLVHISTRPPKGTSASQPEDLDGGFGHIAFWATGLAETKAKLDAKGLKYEERPTPDEGVFQLFTNDPNGVIVEFCFPIAEGKLAAAE